MKKLLIIAVFLGLAGWGAYKLTQRNGAPVATYQSATVSRDDLVKSIQASGSVAPQNRVDLRPPFAGRLEDVLVREGDWVKKGQILAWLSSTERAALLDAARARGPEELKKWEQLYRATPMLSPITGTLIARSFEPGQGVGPSDAVLTVSDRLIVKANVDETDIAQVKNGQAARITLDAYPDQPVDAKAVHIAYEAKTVSNVTVYEVEVAADKIPAFMRSGMTASVEFFTERHPNVLMIPNDAITSVGAGSPRPASARGEWKARHGKDGEAGAHGRRATVLVPASTSPTAKAAEPLEKEIRVGLSDGRNTEVLEGLTEGDSVLIKTVALPSAAGAGKNPFMPQRPARPAPRGAR